MVSGNGSGIIANDANVRFVDYGVTALFSTNIDKLIEYIDHCHLNLLMYKLLTSTREKYESGFVRDQRERDKRRSYSFTNKRRSYSFTKKVICI